MGEISPEKTPSVALAPMEPVGAQVQVKILHALPDMIIVSFEAQDKRIFQGALLHSKQ